MKVVAFLTEYAAVDRIIRHLELTFVAEKPPPSHVFEQVVRMAPEEGGEYEYRAILRRGVACRRLGTIPAIRADNPAQELRQAGS